MYAIIWKTTVVKCEQQVSQLITNFVIHTFLTRQNQQSRPELVQIVWNLKSMHELNCWSHITNKVTQALYYQSMLIDKKVE